MARRKKTKRTQPRLQWLREMNWSNVRRAAIAAAWLIGVGGIGALLAIGVPHMEARATALADYDEVEVQFVDPPAWIEGDIRDDLTLRIRDELRSNPFDRHDGSNGDLPAMRNALLNTGWFNSVSQVRRARADLIIVDGDFADPYALVRNHEGDHLIDTHGRLLPLSLPEGVFERFTVIIGARFDRPSRPGLQWEGSDITAALRLLRLIEAEPWAEQVRSIDVTAQTTGGAIRLITNRDRGSWILWGSAPGEEIAMEALPDQKLRYLNHNFQNFGHIDGNHNGEVDITDHRRVINR